MKYFLPLLRNGGEGWGEEARLPHRQPPPLLPPWGCAERFIAGVTKPQPKPASEPDDNPHRYDGPARTAEQVAA